LHIRESLQQTKQQYLHGLPSNNALLNDIARRYNELTNQHKHHPLSPSESQADQHISSSTNNDSEVSKNSTSQKKDASYDRIGFR
jgi:hypothetical protein